MPCTDWFVSFTYLGKGDVKRSIAFLPISLLLQLFLLPLYLYLFLGEAFFSTIANRLLIAFLSFILLPLLAALLTQEIAFTLRKEAWIKKFTVRAAPIKRTSEKLCLTWAIGTCTKVVYKRSTNKGQSKVDKCSTFIDIPTAKPQSMAKR